MEVLERFTDNFTTPVCTSFRPTLLEGQQCSEIDLNTLIPGNMAGGEGQEHVMLVLDINTDRSIEHGFSIGVTSSSDQFSETNLIQTATKIMKNIFF